MVFQRVECKFILDAYEVFQLIIALSEIDYVV